MITLHFHLQPQYKYELFHINFTSFHCTGRYELNKLTSLPMCGFIAQLVEHRTGIVEVTGSNPVEAVGRALALQGLWRFCPYLLRQYIFNHYLCIGFSEFNKPAMCYISHSHFFSILLFVLPLRTELSTHFILIKVCCYNG